MRAARRRDDELIVAWMSLGAVQLMIRRLSEQQRRRRAEGGQKHALAHVRLFLVAITVTTSKYSPRRGPVITIFQLHSCAHTLPQRPLTYVFPTRDPVVRHVSLPSSSSLLQALVQLTYRDAKSLHTRPPEAGLGIGH